ncbi:nuclear transport factor 2 family protein [Rhodohalobacter mucosus]|uniref:Lumazine-binding protein n=1 Tax=Rhodohalobacter mucosus TaxID=2079485 RepID=A0A316TU59_9BACT|nr:nuclear transport factor 2 family protein [Rhodohalobacter mucosus]PWN08087.1 hypothetical protein DDZ15_00170 [Rhodohalobacter mucosus]
MKSILVSILLITVVTGPQPDAGTPDDDPQKIEGIILQLFDGMRESDREKAAEVFHETMTLSTVVNRNGSVELAQTDITGFLNAVGQPKDQVWDEQISGLQVHIDGNLATAWMNYSFYRGEDFSHCGVNTMNLIRTDDGWKIFSITDTRRTEGCEM